MMAASELANFQSATEKAIIRWPNAHEILSVVVFLRGWLVTCLYIGTGEKHKQELFARTITRFVRILLELCSINMALMNSLKGNNDRN